VVASERPVSAVSQTVQARKYSDVSESDSFWYNRCVIGVRLLFLQLKILREALRNKLLRMFLLYWVIGNAVFTVRYCPLALLVLAIY